MVVEQQIINRYELEWRIFYSVIVAGKSAKFANDVISRWNNLFMQADETPFEAMRRLFNKDEHALMESFKQARTGNYNKVYNAMFGLISKMVNLVACTPEELEQIKGIGPKTSRFFILWTRPDAEYAALDVHILRWLNERYSGIPNTTPQSKTRYRAIERLFLDEAKRLGKTPRQLDLEIWSEASSALNVTPSAKT